jgi:hypothetical protein
METHYRIASNGCIARQVNQVSGLLRDAVQPIALNRADHRWQRNADHDESNSQGHHHFDQAVASDFW